MDYYISLFNDFRSGLSILEHGTEYLIEGWYCVRPLVRWPEEILYHLPPKKPKGMVSLAAEGIERLP